MKKVTNLLFLTLCGGLFMVFALGSSSEVDSSEYNTDKIYSIGETLDCPAFERKTSSLASVSVCLIKLK